MTLYHLEEILNIGKPTLEWIHDFMKNQEFCNYRFKYYCKNGKCLGPNFDFISEWIDIVDNVAEFNAIEENRVPLFIGSEPELLPAVLSEEGLHLKSPIIAILLKTIIVSNKVLGLGFYSIKTKRNNEKSYTKRRELVFFNNPEYDEFEIIESKKRVSINHFKSEITIALVESFSQKPIDRSEVIGFLQKFQDKFREIGDIYLSAKVTACDIVLTGLLVPHLSITFINHPKYPLKLDKLKDILEHLAMDLMERFKQERIVVMHSDETVMFENNDLIDCKIKTK